MNQQKLLNQVIKLISHRPRSQKEIKDYLARKKTSLDLTEKIINHLGKLNLINDEKFAQWWLEQRSNFRPKGKQALRFELWQKGIKREIIDLVLENLDEVSLAKKALKNKSFSSEKKVMFLQRRGFSWETIKSII